jgi:hypothetical protein
MMMDMRLVAVTLCCVCVLSVASPVSAATTTVRGVVKISDMATPEQLRSSAFLDFAQRNARRYLACDDLVANAVMADHRVFRSHVVGKINQGQCTFRIEVVGSSAVTLIFLTNQHGAPIGHRVKPSSSDSNEVTRVWLTFHKIEIEHAVGKTAATDNWNLGGPTPKPSPR